MQKIIQVNDFENLIKVLGPKDENIKKLAKQYDVKIWERGNKIVVEGKAAEVHLIEKIIHNILTSEATTRPSMQNSNKESMTAANLSKFSAFFTTYKLKQVAPRTINQKKYVENLMKNDIVFAIGPAGTGKTFLAVAVAVSKLLDGKVDRIILTRPVIEAGEKLGFLPGDLNEKLNPYIRPLEDAFIFLIGPEKYNYYRETKMIEIVPLAYMRGRTLNNAYIILDEAQNSTNAQMFMFLTRMGENAQIAVTGDVTQTDLVHSEESGLRKAAKILSRIKAIKFVQFTGKDVVRHFLVKKIIEAYGA
ncbi:MAG: PhoH family protein [bacterium]|nr:PhoH family protein [bacterium]